MTNTKASRLIGRSFAVLLSGPLLPGAASAQSVASGTIAGLVTDSTGAVPPGVVVEAASPVLIEKVRSAVTDSAGLYRIVELQPGTYTVVFALPGFNTVRREGVELTSGFTASVDAELRVGALEESVVVSGASPVVDTHNVRAQTVLSRDVLAALPNSNTFRTYAPVTLGATNSVGGHDVGGNKGELYNQFVIHGGRGNDQRTTQDGMPIITLEAGSGGSRFRVNEAAVAETTVQTSGMSAESETGGIQINIVPREGGNRFNGYGNVAYTNDIFQGDNLTDELRARGVQTPSTVDRIYDYGMSIGGPIVRDKLWLLVANRWWGARNIAPGNYWDKTPNDLFYEPDLARPAYTDNYNRDNTLRLTWQAARKHKANLSWSVQDNCSCYLNVEGSSSPETTVNQVYIPVYLIQGTWHYTMSNRFLFQAGVSYLRGDADRRRDPGVSIDAIPVTDQGVGYSYGAPTTAYDDAKQYIFSQSAAMSYVTGSHAFKVGLSAYEAKRTNDTVRNTAGLGYSFRNQVPVSVTEYASGQHLETRTAPNLGVFAQDQWTIRRMTLNLGVRFDYLNMYVPASTQPAGRFVTSQELPGVDGVPTWKDLSPRLGVVYDLFGNGRTALKASLGRFNENETSALAAANTPANTIVTTATRTWNDAFYGPGDARSRNYQPDCDLSSVLTNGECGALSPSTFGQSVVTTRYLPELLRGFGIRPYNWQGSIAFQQEVRSGTAISVGWFRTSWGNFRATNNLLVTPADYDPYCVTAPVMSGLPGNGGFDVCGLYDLTPSKFGAVNNVVEPIDGYEDIYSGAEVALNARFGGGGRLSGGVSTGQHVIDNCTIVDSPQSLYCRTVNSWKGQTQYKLALVYPLRWGLTPSVVFQNLPGTQILATRAYTNAEIAPSLGRNLSSCPTQTGPCSATVSIPLIEPNTQFEDRLTQLDIRVVKHFSVGRARMQGMFDAYNVFNASTILARNNTVGATWGRPTSILGARLLKLGLQVNF